MSFYRPVRANPTIADFVRGIDHYMGEFAQFGLTVPSTKPMQFSEVGIGGGHVTNKMKGEPAKAAAAPWEGSGNPRENPWRDPAMQSLRRQFHRELLKFLESQPARWEVNAAFFWSMGSWDPIAAQNSEWADPEIKAAVERHNRAVLSR